MSSGVDLPPDSSAVNAFERKQNVVPVEEAVTPASTLRRTFPAWSVNGLELTVAV